ncbi:MAG: UDP-N-acetylmuramoyl-L-alanine--D-glutamate ligase [bacterium]
MRILFVGKGISNDGAIKLAQQLKIKYDYINVNDNVDNNYSVIVKGPGISYDEKILRRFIKLNKLVVTDIEFVYWFLNRYYIGVTGSNGKTTTTLLINDILNKKYKSIACGNIGYSIGEASVENKECTHFVCELSSFELKGTNLFTPNIAVITNINCCHLDYHKTIEDYILSKKKLIDNQSINDYLIYNLDCNTTKTIISNSVAKKYSFSLYDQTADCYIKNNYIYFNNKRIIKIKKLKEKNIETLGNYLASIIVGNILNINKKDIKKSLITFKKSDYRFQYIKKNIINDAKSTNVYSTISAIKSIKKPIILISGGLYRNYELNQLDNYLINIQLVVSYGETNDLLKSYFEKNNIKCIKVENLVEATLEALKYLNKNNVLLYSPMFASYDLFKSYQQRGELFNKLIK